MLVADDVVGAEAPAGVVGPGVRRIPADPGDGTHRELRLPRQAELADEDHVERGAEPLGHRNRHRDPAARQREDDDGPVGAGDPAATTASASARPPAARSACRRRPAGNIMAPACRLQRPSVVHDRAASVTIWARAVPPGTDRTRRAAQPGSLVTENTKPCVRSRSTSGRPSAVAGVSTPPAAAPPDPVRPATPSSSRTSALSPSMTDVAW